MTQREKLIAFDALSKNALAHPENEDKAASRYGMYNDPIKDIEINYVTSFSQFKAIVKRKGGIWNTEHVYFTQFRDGYGASYQPEWPHHSREDQAITYNWIEDQWKYISPGDYDKQYNA